MVHKVSSKRRGYGYLYTREMLEMFSLLKGKKLLNYEVAVHLMLDAGGCVNFFKFEGFDFYVNRIESGHTPSFESKFQEIGVVYNEKKDSDSQLEDDIKDHIVVEMINDSSEPEICEIVEDIILELDSLHGEQNEVVNVIFKLKDKYLTPSLHIDDYNVFGEGRKKEIYHQSLEQYKAYAVAHQRKKPSLSIKEIEQNSKCEIENEQKFCVILYGMKMWFALAPRKVGYNPEFVTLQSYLESHPV